MNVDPDSRDPMSVPPIDHGSDRYNHVEFCCAPPGVTLTDSQVDKALADACADCNPNLFFCWQRPHVWALTIAHDDTCPRLKALEAESGS